MKDSEKQKLAAVEAYIEGCQGLIDPKKARFEDVDLPEGDLGVRAYILNATPLQCLLACIDNDRCVAFTYIKKEREC